MKGKLLKRIALSTGALFLLLVVVLGVHIYIVTRPKPIGPNDVVMARIDLHQEIKQEDADKIITYMNTQPGVQHTVVSLNYDNVVFTFYPYQTKGNDIVKKFKTDLHYDSAVRYMPSLAQMSGSCPAGYGSGGNSFYSKIISFFK